MLSMKPFVICTHFTYVGRLSENRGIHRDLLVLINAKTRRQSTIYVTGNFPRIEYPHINESIGSPNTEPRAEIIMCAETGFQLWFYMYIYGLLQLSNIQVTNLQCMSKV